MQSYLALKVRLEPIIFLPCGGFTSVHVLWSSIAILFLLEWHWTNFVLPGDFLFLVILSTTSVQLLVLSHLHVCSDFVSSDSVYLFSGVLLISMSNEFSFVCGCLFWPLQNLNHLQFCYLNFGCYLSMNFTVLSIIAFFFPSMYIRYPLKRLS